MKNLTKTEKENRLRKFRKAKDIILYVSLALNVLIITCCAVVGCSNKSNDHQQQSNNLVKNQLVSKNKLNEVNQSVNENCVSYDLKYLDINKINDTSPYWNTTNTIAHALRTDISIVTGGSVITGVNALAIQYDLRVDVTNRFVSVMAYDLNAGLSSSNIISYFLSTNGGAWQRYDNVIGGSATPQYSSENGFWFIYNKEIYNDETFSWEWVLPYFFAQSEYLDYDLNYGWSPLSYYTNTYGVFNGTKADMSYEWLIDVGALAINGHVYTNIGIMWTNNSWNGGYVRVNAYVNGEVQELPTGKPYSWPVAVVAYNTYNNKALTIWQIPTGQQTYENNNLAAITTYVMDGRINDASKGRVRVFAVNENRASVSGYTNGSVLAATYNGYAGGGVAGFGDVFGLFTSAFTGLTGLFSIAILPNITLGMLLFLPLIGTIIFALVKILKK